ncbi:MAG: DUF4367 domain-containing protein [Ruminococcaceae bacterium]|nr:DUF4367 domain-containing protein [Oscillospiraceae bacterium]
MRRSVEKQLDTLLCLALEEHAKKTAASIAAMDTSSVVRPDWIDEKVRKTIESHTPKFGAVRRKSPARVLAIAAIITAMIVLTLSVSGLGKTIWRSIVSWYEDFVSVSFVPSPSEDAAETQAPPAESLGTPTEPSVTEPQPPAAEVPTVILEYRKPQGLPEGYIGVETFVSGLVYTLDFSQEDEWCFTFTQSLLKDEMWYDNSELNLKHMEINGNPAVILFYGENEFNAITWFDGEYVYKIQGFLAKSDLISFAESVK